MERNNCIGGDSINADKVSYNAVFAEWAKRNNLLGAQNAGKLLNQMSRLANPVIEASNLIQRHIIL